MKNPRRDRFGGSFVCRRRLVAARDPLDITAAQADIVQFTIGKAAQFTTGHTGIVPRGQDRQSFRDDAMNASNSIAAVRFNRRHFITFS